MKIIAYCSIFLFTYDVAYLMLSLIFFLSFFAPYCWPIIEYYTRRLKLGLQYFYCTLNVIFVCCILLFMYFVLTLFLALG